MFKNSGITVIKTGGHCARDDSIMSALADELYSLHNDGEKILLVHGGGATITHLQKQFGITPRFIRGLRQTAPDEMPLVDMALSGAVNKQLVRLFIERGLPAWGLSGADGGILTGESATGDASSNRTGVIRSVNVAPIMHVWQGGFFPILSPSGTDRDGHALNFNADEAALAMARALQADRLIFFSDVPGVINDGKTIPMIAAAEVNNLIRTGMVSGGMIPKLESATRALSSGIGMVYIAEFQEIGDMNRVLSGKQGTGISQ